MSDALPSLLARVKEAKGPDKELFRSVAYALLKVSEVRSFDAFWRCVFAEAWESAALALCERSGWRVYTLDASIEDRCSWTLISREKRMQRSDLDGTQQPLHDYAHGAHSDKCLALLAALLTAKMEQTP